MHKIDINEFQIKLLNSTSAEHGKFGEMIYEKYLTLHNINYRRVHAGGIDFEVDQLGSVDLKTRKILSKKNQNIIKYKNKLKNVNYVYLILYPDNMKLLLEKNDTLTEMDELRWENYESVIANFHVKEREEIKSNEIDKVKKTLKDWIKLNWDLNAKVISRTGRAAQDAFEKNGWGPNNFYTDKAHEKFKIVVLLYFDKSAIYKIFAYPLTHSHLIDWIPKNKGPNLGGIIIFDPRQLKEIFIFDSIEQLKKEFMSRFQ